MPEPIFRIFISSTYIDLIEYRKAAANAIGDLGQKYEGMEYMGASDKEPKQACLDLVKNCDLFIGIYAWRYGHIPAGSDVSITELEFDHAKKLDIPCRCYFVDENFPWQPPLIERCAEDKLKKFKNKISGTCKPGIFKEPLHLEKNIIRDLGAWLADNRPQLRRDALKPGQDPSGMYKKAIAGKYAVLSMIGFNRSFPMDGIYIPLTLHVDQESCPRPGPEKTSEKIFQGPLKAEDLATLPEKTAVVLGEPGMGKTTMLHYLALMESKKSNGLFPIFVKLSDFCQTRDPLESFLLSAVENHIVGPCMQEAAIKALQGGALVLLDGLDEVGREDYGSATERIRAFISAHNHCRVIVTSRKAGFQSHEAPYRIFEIDKLPMKEIKIFTRKWFGEEETGLASRIEGNCGLRELAQNPFLLSIICLIFEKDRNLPERRVELYKKCATKLLTLFDEKQALKVDAFTRPLKERVLEDIAHYFFCKGVDEFPYEPLMEQTSKTLAEMKQQGNEEKVLREIRENSGLLQKSDDNHIFVHRTFLEYYVSRKIRGESMDAVLRRAAEPRWEEPIRLYAAQIESITEGTQFIGKLWKKDRAMALRCYPDMDRVVEPELIKNLLHQADVDERVALVKGLPGKISEPGKVVETLRELFRWETNGEVLYWGARILEEKGSVHEAPDIVYLKLDEGAKERYNEYLEKDMISIPVGRFGMGAREGEYEDEKPIHEVKLDSFFISRFQVSNRLFEKFDPNHKQRRNDYSNGDNQPVIYVNWYEAVMFCRWLGCRLPTEAQWEYACRAGTETPFNTGDNLTTDPPNAWGLYDMHGNVREWCLDWYGENYYYECHQKGTVENPPGPEKGSDRVLRGGSWDTYGVSCRSAYRGNAYPDYRDRYVGFRLVFVPQSVGG